MAQTLLKTLLVQRHWQHYETFAVQFRRAATELGDLQQDAQLRTLDISRRQLERWTSGSLTSTPRPRQCRVLEHLFGLPAGELLAPAMEVSPVPPSSVDDPSSIVERVERSSRMATEFVLSTDSGNGPHVIDELYGQLSGLARNWVRRPASFFIDDLIVAQRLVLEALRRENVPSRSRDLYFLASLAFGLLGKACQDVGQIDAALTHVRTASFCADRAEHPRARAWSRGLESLVLFWAGDTHLALRKAQEGRSHLEPGHGSVAAWLPALEARASGILGDGDAMRDAIRATDRAREEGVRDDLDAIGGLLYFPGTKSLYYTSEAIVLHSARDGSDSRIGRDKAAEAVEAYRNADPSEWAFSDEAGACATLALAHARGGDAEAAEEALRPMLAMESSSRIHGIVRSFQRVQAALMSDTFRRSAAASELLEQIDIFTRGHGMTNATTVEVNPRR